MNYRVTILQTPFRFDVTAGETVLQAALRQEIPVPWGCGGGVCGVCMGKIVSGDMH
jgi:ferredoxin